MFSGLQEARRNADELVQEEEKEKAEAKRKEEKRKNKNKRVTDNFVSSARML